MAVVVSTEDRLARDDADLMAGIVAGNFKEPVAKLYSRHGQRLYWFGVQLLGDRGLADELVQESFVRLWRTADRFDLERGTVAAYLFVIARSIAEDLRRRPSSRPLALIDEEQVRAWPADADRIINALAVQDALASLSVANREVLILAYREGLPQSQIAERLRVPLGTVKTRMFQGLRALKTALAQRGYGG
jgi:RNA polymerase sigma-70 factor (ECF subfamily)